MSQNGIRLFVSKKYVAALPIFKKQLKPAVGFCTVVLLTSEDTGI